MRRAFSGAGVSTVLVAMLASWWMLFGAQLCWAQASQPHARYRHSILRQILNAEAERRFKDRGVHVSLWMQDDHVANWAVYLSPDRFPECLTRPVSAHEDSLVDQLVAWSRQANAELLELTSWCFKLEGREHFNPELDHSLMVSGAVLPPGEYGQAEFHVSFKGERLVYVLRPGDGSHWDQYARTSTGNDADPQADRERLLAEQEASARKFWPLYPSPDPPAPSGESELTWEIRPSKSTWNAGETITGEITLRNTGTRRIHVEASRGPAVVAITDIEGGGLERFYFDGRIRKVAPDSHNVYLLPGGVITNTFEIHTAPGGWVEFGYHAPPGEYVLSRPPIENMVMLGAPVRITVIE